MIQLIRNLLVFGAVVVTMLGLAGAQDNQIKKIQVKPASPLSGARIFKEYCAVCHGPTAKGDGPVADALKISPPDLTKLAERHGGKFPADYVDNILKNGVKNPAHGSGKMPVWGPIFDSMESWKALCPCQKETPALRITNLTDYLKSLQK